MSFWATRDLRQGRCLARLGLGARRDALIWAAHPLSGCGSPSVCCPSGTVTRRGSRRDCPARSSTAHLAVPSARARREQHMSQVIIGVDPHKLSATIEVVDDREKVLGSGRFTTDRAGYAAMRRYAKAWPERVWAVEGANGVGPTAGAAAAGGRRAGGRRPGQARRPGPALRHRPQPQDRRARRALDRGRRGPHQGAAGAEGRRRAGGAADARRPPRGADPAAGPDRQPAAGAARRAAPRDRRRRTSPPLQAKAMLASVRPRDIAGKTRRRHRGRGAGRAGRGRDEDQEGHRRAQGDGAGPRLAR